MCALGREPLFCTDVSTVAWAAAPEHHTTSSTTLSLWTRLCWDVRIALSWIAKRFTFQAWLHHGYSSSDISATRGRSRMLVRSLPCLVKAILGDSRYMTVIEKNGKTRMVKNGDREVTDRKERAETEGNKRGKIFLCEKRKRKGKIILGRMSVFLSQDGIVSLVPLWAYTNHSTHECKTCAFFSHTAVLVPSRITLLIH